MRRPLGGQRLWLLLRPVRCQAFDLPHVLPRLADRDRCEGRGAELSADGTAFTDSVFITSRDGRNFRHSNDVFLPPGLRTRHNWSYGDNYIARHIVETASTKDDSPRELSLNVATSAAGKVQIALLNPAATPIPGFTREDCDLIFGDSLDYRVSWKGNTSVAALIGKPVVLKVWMQEADLFAMQFRE